MSACPMRRSAIARERKLGTLPHVGSSEAEALEREWAATTESGVWGEPDPEATETSVQVGSSREVIDRDRRVVLKGEEFWEDRRVIPEKTAEELQWRFETSLHRKQVVDGRQQSPHLPAHSSAHLKQEVSPRQHTITQHQLHEHYARPQLASPYVHAAAGTVQMTGASIQRASAGTTQSPIGLNQRTPSRVATASTYYSSGAASQLSSSFAPTSHTPGKPSHNYS